MKVWAPETTEFANPMQLTFYADRVAKIMGGNFDLSRNFDEQNKKYSVKLNEKLPNGVHEAVYRQATRIVDQVADLDAVVRDNTLYGVEYGPKNSGARRVFAVRSVDQKKNTVYLFGFGKYVGDEVPDQEAGGLAGPIRHRQAANPKIVLDNGIVVWGCECWWGPEERFAKDYGKFAIVQASLEGFRAESKGTLN